MSFDHEHERQPGDHASESSATSRACTHRDWSLRLETPRLDGWCAGVASVPFNTVSILLHRLLGVGGNVGAMQSGGSRILNLRMQASFAVKGRREVPNCRQPNSSDQRAICPAFGRKRRRHGIYRAEGPDGWRRRPMRMQYSDVTAFLSLPPPKREFGQAPDSRRPISGPGAYMPKRAKPIRPPPAGSRPENKLLACLPAADFERLLPHLKTIPLQAKQILHPVIEPVRQGGSES